MRVVGGCAKGTNLLSVPGTTTRPILDRVKTALFDILRPVILDIEVLDMFAGSGGVGIEALSQGARHCTFLDIEKAAIDTIRANLEKTHLSDQADVRNTDAFRFIRNTSKAFDLIYIAPPQYKNLWIEALAVIAERPTLLKVGGQVIVQIDPTEYESFPSSTIGETKQRKYGNTLLLWYSALEGTTV